MEILKSWVKLSTCISTDFICLFVCFRRQGGFQMLNKCELRQEHISSFQEPKAQVSLNKRAQMPQRTWCNSCNWLEAFSVSQNHVLALPSLLPLQAGLKVAAETSPLFFFCVPSAWEAGQGFTPQPWGSSSSMSLSRVVVLPLYMSCKTWSLGFVVLSHWYGNKNIHYSLEEERFSNHVDSWSVQVRDEHFLHKHPKEERCKAILHQVMCNPKQGGLQSNEVRLSESRLFTMEWMVTIPETIIFPQIIVLLVCKGLRWCLSPLRFSEKTAYCFISSATWSSEVQDGLERVKLKGGGQPLWLRL